MNSILLMVPDPEVAIALQSMSLLELKRRVLRSIHLDRIWRDDKNTASHLVLRNHPCHSDLVGISLLPGGKFLVELMNERLSLTNLAAQKCVGSVLLPVQKCLKQVEKPFVALLSGHEVGFVLPFIQGNVLTVTWGTLHIYRVDTLSSNPGFHLIVDINTPLGGRMRHVAVAGNLLAFEYERRHRNHEKFIVVRDIGSHKQATMEWNNLIGTIWTLEILSERWLLVVVDAGMNLVDISSFDMIPCTGNFVEDLRHAQRAAMIRIHEDERGATWWEGAHPGTLVMSAPRYLGQPIFLGTAGLYIVNDHHHTPSIPTLSMPFPLYPTKVLQYLGFSPKMGTRRAVSCPIHFGALQPPRLVFCAAPNGDDFDLWKEEDFVISEVDLALWIPPMYYASAFTYDEASGRMCIALRCDSGMGVVGLIVVDVR
ncbi:hypothetical protein JAAARDRAFT_63118 [Jaapia argillacea MUCL 33604]|uniref:F-box domain-containing protein n=1 Tax=Jaapia argillacea MUCL 33604 TaxID=933084 RepID=A0A067P6J1_9AGAM|nr:hypothetical protein JAAARDRAFT_63118 [Jaapia argillacea MUCL 33604]